MIEFDRVTTRGGDEGKSSLHDGSRLWKDDLVFELLGAVDKLTSYLGLLRSQVGKKSIGKQIASVQKKLLVIGSLAATPSSSDLFAPLEKIVDEDVNLLEEYEARLLAETRIEDRFVIPGDDPISARVDVARTLCREAERRIVSCIRDRSMAHLIPSQNYLNRLSDYLFVLARNLEQNPPR
jgi:cob(I)alamin adenosyltransferase